MRDIMARVRHWLAERSLSAAGLAVLGLLALLAWTDPAPLQRVRLQVFDGWQRLAPAPVASGAGQVVVVDIDEASIATLGQWPWPRTDLATLTTRLGQAGAKVVAFDVVFSEPDRTSPEQLATRLGLPALAALPGHDAALAQSFASVPVVAGFFLDRQRIGRAVEPAAPFLLHGSLPTRSVAQYQGALLPLPVLEQAAAGTGSLTLEADPDGIVRRAPLVAIHRGTLVPSLGLEAVRLATGAGNPDLTTSDGSGETLAAPGAAVSVRLGDTVIPVDAGGEMWVHYPRNDTRPVLSAARIIGGEISPQALREVVGGRIVFVGGSAVGLQDLVSTPLSERTAGVNTHAAAAEQMLAGHFLQRPDWAFALEWVLALLAGGALALSLPRLGAARGAVVALAGVALAVGGSWLAFTRAGYLLDPTWPVLALLAVYTVQTVLAFRREERRRSYIHRAFDRYLSPELVRQIAADPGRLELGGEERDMSVLMADIRGFSRISERLSPRQVIDFLVAFLTPMSAILLARKATLDKYIGDAVLAFWNAPLDDPEHPQNAARAALEMVAKVAELNRTMPRQNKVPWPGEVKIGVGLNTGLCCVGNMGSAERLSYTLIGDTVNVASRLEGLTKLYGVPIAVGEAMAARLPGFALLELDRVRVVGRDQPATPSALLGDETLAADPQFLALRHLHDQMLAAYRPQEWDAAERLLAEGQPLYAALGIPGLHALYRQRVATLRADPPGAGWDGVFTATEK
ncbi:CHASE2 domain-containing protein [Alteraurantiacibacter buctensis]|uniref:CHASE2 domain-containing protein n=1 Tax=Alteraurantiacibacter buctensis TaxID=1503981 RepID=A0A844YXN7_9SPHN|nr:adenylate/guanylate cyclase domain-containing protein [Alteraurantiacibacter buctensis]MXO71561.1 CHASE2 domain-containing protein [Alteraurantiacibacter buctensis]